MTGLFSLLRIRSLWILVILFVVGEVPFTTKKTSLVNAQSAPISIPDPSSNKTSATKPVEQPSPLVKPIPIGAPEVSILTNPNSSSTKNSEAKPIEQNIPAIKPTTPITTSKPVIPPQIDPSSSKNSESKPTSSPNPDPKPASIDPSAPVIPNVPAKVPTTNKPLSKPNALPISSDLNPIEISRSITVKITAPDFIGSGTIVGFDKGTYTVITNAHVIIGGKPPYQITTSDRVVHPVKIIPSPEFKKYDLAVIQFRAPARKYAVAKLGNSASLKVGDRLFVGGFTKQSKQRDRNDFLVQTGAVSLVLKSGMDDSGYKIGYTHRIYRGMSGGSVIDTDGKLVGINGLLGDPIWKVQTKFADGSSACEPLQILIDKSGFAIAIDDITSLTTHAKWWKKQVAAEPNPVNEKTLISEQEAIKLQQSAIKAASCN
jgi:S1-C subfamily serine protease